jgi:hypothetical protein
MDYEFVRGIFVIERVPSLREGGFKVAVDLDLTRSLARADIPIVIFTFDVLGFAAVTAEWKPQGSG